LAAAAPDSLPVRADPGRIAQIIDNLLSNALKFTPKDGRIEVAAMDRGARLVVEVRDTGRGLDPSEAVRLFKPFSQVHQPGEIKERGTGLGLFISRGLAHAHGGDL